MRRACDACGDTRGLALFDLSLEGFWKSFAAALLVAPAYAIVLLDQYSVIGWPEMNWTRSSQWTP